MWPMPCHLWPMSSLLSLPGHRRLRLCRLSSNYLYLYEISRITNMKFLELQIYNSENCKYEIMRIPIMVYESRIKIKGQGTTGAQLQIFIVCCSCVCQTVKRTSYMDKPFSLQSHHYFSEAMFFVGPFIILAVMAATGHNDSYNSYNSYYYNRYDSSC